MCEYEQHYELCRSWIELEPFAGEVTCWSCDTEYYQDHSCIWSEDAEDSYCVEEIRLKGKPQ